MSGDTATRVCNPAFFVGPPRFVRLSAVLPPALTAGELIDWMALSRVRAGAVVRCGEDYLDGGAPMPRYLLPEMLFDVLGRVGLLAVGERDELGWEKLSLTEAGRSRFQVACSAARPTHDRSPSRRRGHRALRHRSPDRVAGALPHLATRPGHRRSPLMVSLARTVYAAPTSDPSELLDTTRFPDQAAVEHHLLEAFIPAAYLDLPPAPGTPSTSAQVRHLPEQARRWLTFLARHLDTLATPDLAWWQLTDIIPRFIRGISAGLTTGLVFGFAGILAGTGVADTIHHLEGLVLGLLFGLATALSYSVSKRPEPLRVKMRFQGTLASFLRRFVFGLVLGVGVGLAVGLPSEGVLATGLAFGFALAAPVWLDIPTDVTQEFSPRVVLKQDRTAAFSFGLAVALPFGLAGGLVVGFPSELAFGIIGGVAAMLVSALMGGVAGGVVGGHAYGRVGGCMFALAGAVVGGLVFEPPHPGSHPILGLAYGVTLGLAVGCVGVLSRAWGAYTVSRIWLALRGDLPWQLMRFLDDAHRRGVLRQSGAIYQFRHTRLQNHLAHPDPNPH